MAREEARAWSEQALRGELTIEGAQAKKKPTTIATMMDRWLDDVIDASDLSPATKAGHRTNATRIRKTFGEKTPADLTTPALRAWVRIQRSELSASRCRNVFNTLGKFLDDARAEGWVDASASNPCRDRNVHKELPPVAERDDAEKARHTEAEVSVLLASMRARSAADPMAACRFVRYVLAFTSGMRDGGLAGLR